MRKQQATTVSYEAPANANNTFSDGFVKKTKGLVIQGTAD